MKKILSTICFITFLTLYSWGQQSLTEKFNACNLFKGHVTLIGTLDLTPLIRDAKKSQGTPYCPDEWEQVRLPVGDTVVQGDPGESNFYTICHTLRQNHYQKTDYWKALQVKEHATQGYRSSVVLYVIEEPVTAGLAKVLKNIRFGPGGAWQLYIPTSEKSKLRKIRTENLH